MEKYKQLSMVERSLIQSQLTLGFKPSWIALSLGRSVSTIIRELKRNSWVHTTGVVIRGRPAIAGKYRALLAQDREQGFSAAPRVARRLQAGNDLWKVVVTYLKQGYSP
jgi:IS30 family transposase